MQLEDGPDEVRLGTDVRTRQLTLDVEMLKVNTDCSDRSANEADTNAPADTGDIEFMSYDHSNTVDEIPTNVGITSAPHTPIDTDDEFDLSDIGESIENPSTTERPSLNGIASLSEHLGYLSQALMNALDSIDLDKSLAIQAKTSGLLNSETHRLLEKTQELAECMSRLDKLYKGNFVPRYDSTTKTSVRSVDVLNQRYIRAENRLHILLHGKKTKRISRIFAGKHSTTGVPDRYPIEYNQARDKVLERTHGDPRDGG